VNAEVGDHVAEMWGWDGGAHVLLGEVEAHVEAGAVTVVDVRLGTDRGYTLQDACLADCG
jgi:hypothetical protein